VGHEKLRSRGWDRVPHAWGFLGFQISDEEKLYCMYMYDGNET
jgi:hypothetical protein